MRELQLPNISAQAPALGVGLKRELLLVVRLSSCDQLECCSDQLVALASHQTSCKKLQEPLT